MSARSHSPIAKAFRCESCGAGLPPDNPVCLYCGSQHNLPAYPAESMAAPEPAKGNLGAVIAIGLVLLASTAALAWWFLT